jgi:hypothetical protein
MPLFVSIDTPLSSVCRLYELSILVEGSNLQHAYAMELDYFFKHSGWQDLSASQVSDPRQRWKNLDVREPEVFGGLIDVVKKLVVVEENKYGGSGELPVWAGGDDPGRL